MEHVFSTEERTAARLDLQERLLHRLWMAVLEEGREPVETAGAHEYLLRDEFEQAADGLADREAARIQQLLVEPMEKFWAGITAELEENEQPIPYTPTEYGYRLGGQTDSGASPQSDQPDDTPDQ